MKRGAQTAQRILTEALALFAESGYDRTTLAEIAKKVGITEPAIYRHFKDKRELFLACVTAGFPEAASPTLAHLTQVHDLRSLVRAWLGLRFKMIDEQKASFDILFTEWPRHPELVDLYVDRVMGYWRGDIRLLLERLPSMGLGRTPDPRIIGIGLLSAIWGMSRFGERMTQRAGLAAPAGAPDLLENMTDFVLYGIAGKAMEQKEGRFA